MVPGRANGYREVDGYSLGTRSGNRILVLTEHRGDFCLSEAVSSYLLRTYCLHMKNRFDSLSERALGYLPILLHHFFRKIFLEAFVELTFVICAGLVL